MNEADSQIDYELLAQNALRGVVRQVLEGVVADGLPGDHHFYICFDTRAPGVIVSKRLREQYPDEMTVVLQHRFWDLIVEEQYFEVKLTFNNIPERLVVPYRAIKVFYDPSVPYGLQFEASQMMATTTPKPSGDLARTLSPETPTGPTTDAGLVAEFPSPVQRSSTPESASDAETPLGNLSELREIDGAGEVAESTSQSEPDPTPVEDDESTLQESAKVVELDAFRKK